MCLRVSAVRCVCAYVSSEVCASLHVYSVRCVRVSACVLSEVCACVCIYTEVCTCMSACISSEVCVCVCVLRCVCASVSAVRCVCACLWVYSVRCVCACLRVSAVRCVRACVWLTVPSHPARSALGVLGSLAWPRVSCARGPPPSLPAQMRRGCAGTGVADSWTGPTDGVECWARLPPPAPHTCAQRQRTSVPPT